MICQHYAKYFKTQYPVSDYLICSLCEHEFDSNLKIEHRH